MAAADDTDRLGDVERTALPQHKVDDDRELAEEHRGEDEQAPQRRAPEFPDVRRPVGNRGRDFNGTCGSKGIHQMAFTSEIEFMAVRAQGVTVIHFRGAIGKS